MDTMMGRIEFAPQAAVMVPAVHFDLHLAAENKKLREALHNIRDNLRRGGATLPAPEVQGTIESAVVTGMSCALAVVEIEMEHAGLLTPNA